MEIEVEPTQVTGPGLLVRKDERTILHFPDPIRATVTTDSVTMRLVVTIDANTNRPVVDELHLTRRPDGRPVGADALRALGLKDAVKEIAERCVSRFVLADDGKTWRLDFAGAAPHEATLVFKQSGNRAVKFTEIEQAASAYRRAVSEGRRDATIAVADELHVSRTTAARRIKKAREAGLLGAPLTTRAGEGKIR